MDGSRGTSWKVLEGYKREGLDSIEGSLRYDGEQSSGRECGSKRNKVVYPVVVVESLLETVR